MGWRAWPRTARGARVLSRRPQICAPIRVKGFTTRPMGRDRRESSPVIVKKRSGWEAKMPNISRRVVPELPASNTPIGSCRLPMPMPRTVTRSVFSSLISAPKARKQAAVLRGSSPNSRPSMVVSPSAKAPSIRARWEMDLSPGIRTRPTRGQPSAVGERISRWRAFTNSDVTIGWSIGRSTGFGLAIAPGELPQAELP